MAMSDRIAVMNAGRVDQVGTPIEIYSHPRTRFVADFIGEINLFEGEWQGSQFRLADGRAVPAAGAAARAGRATIAVRPERMRLAASGQGVLDGSIETANFLGGQVIYRIRVAAGGERKLLVKEANMGTPARPVGAGVGIAWLPEDAVALAD